MIKSVVSKLRKESNQKFAFVAVMACLITYTHVLLTLTKHGI